MKRKTGFTLLELLIVIIILGILAAVAMPIYTNAVEKRKGEVCINNMYAIFAAWHIYNIKNSPGYLPTESDEWLNISTINQRFNIKIDERNFGSVIAPQFSFCTGGTGDNRNLRLVTNRIRGTYQDRNIICFYFYPNAQANETGQNVTYDWRGAWPFLPDDA